MTNLGVLRERPPVFLAVGLTIVMPLRFDALSSLAAGAGVETALVSGLAALAFDETFFCDVGLLDVDFVDFGFFATVFFEAGFLPEPAAAATGFFVPVFLATDFFAAVFLVTGALGADVFLGFGFVVVFWAEVLFNAFFTTFLATFLAAGVFLDVFFETGFLTVAALLEADFFTRDLDDGAVSRRAVTFVAFFFAVFFAAVFFAKSTPQSDRARRLRDG